jgi:hypothetical protein
VERIPSRQWVHCLDSSENAIIPAAVGGDIDRALSYTHLNPKQIKKVADQFGHLRLRQPLRSWY